MSKFILAFKIYREALVPALVFDKVLHLQSVILLKKKLRQECFPENFQNFSEHLFAEYLQATASEILIISAPHRYFTCFSKLITCQVDQPEKAFL